MSNNDDKTTSTPGAPASPSAASSPPPSNDAQATNQSASPFKRPPLDALPASGAPIETND